MLQDVLRSYGGAEVAAIDVYRDMFKFGEGYLQNENVEKGGYKANPIAYWRNKDAKKGHYRILFEDTFEERLEELQKADFCIVNGITYFGRKNLQEHASKMFAMIFDLDGVTDETLINFMSGCTFADAYPMPNYIVLSGHGLHLYYLFENPISLYPNLKLQLKELKYAMTDLLWNRYTSTAETKQRQGINQGFRVIGGKTKDDATSETTVAYRMNSHPYSLAELCRYVEMESRVDETKLFKESKMTLEDAKKAYPEWYEKVVVNRDSSRKRWKIEEKVNGDDPYALYNWWQDRMLYGAAYNHRYFCVMAMAIYAAKCNVPYERLKKDAYAFIPFLHNINPAEPFTDKDVESALECYDSRYVTFPIKDLESLSAIQIKRNKRNGRKQSVHLARMRAVQMVDDPEGNWRNKKGRPVGSGKKKQIIEYMENHPEEKVAQVARELGVSRTTATKYAKEYKAMKAQIEADKGQVFEYWYRTPKFDILIESTDRRIDEEELKKYLSPIVNLRNRDKDGYEILAPGVRRCVIMYE